MYGTLSMLAELCANNIDCQDSCLPLYVYNHLLNVLWTV